MNKIDEQRALRRRTLKFFFHHVCLRTEDIMSSGYIDSFSVVPLAFLATMFLKMGSTKNVRILMANEHVLEQSEKDSNLFAEASKRGYTDILKQLADRPGFELPALLETGACDLEAFLPEYGEPLTSTLRFYANHPYFNSTKMANEVIQKAANLGSKKVLKEMMNDKRIDWESIREGFLDSVCRLDYKIIDFVLNHEQFASEDPDDLQHYFIELYDYASSPCEACLEVFLERGILDEKTKYEFKNNRYGDLLTIFSSDVAYEYLEVLLSAKPDMDIWRKNGKDFKKICEKETTDQVHAAELFLEHSDGPAEVLFDAIKIAADNQNIELMDVILDKLKRRKEEENNQNKERHAVGGSDYWCSLIKLGIY
jgi:hypothetical protein